MVRKLRTRKKSRVKYGSSSKRRIYISRKRKINKTNRRKKKIHRTNRRKRKAKSIIKSGGSTSEEREKRKEREKRGFPIKAHNSSSQTTLKDLPTKHRENAKEHEEKVEEHREKAKEHANAAVQMGIIEEGNDGDYPKGGMEEKAGVVKLMHDEAAAEHNRAVRENMTAEFTIISDSAKRKSEKAHAAEMLMLEEMEEREKRDENINTLRAENEYWNINRKDYRILKKL